MSGPSPDAPSSAPCLHGQADDPAFTGDRADFAQVRRWRMAQRGRLRALRDAVPAPLRASAAAALADHLDSFLAAHLPDLSGRVVAVYWPIKAEPDLRDWFDSLRRRKALLALPAPETPARPMGFRRWQSGAPLERGFGGIPVPPASAGSVTPGIVLAPLIGWDDAGYRLGYGAGYFDRTLAALADPPLAIGIGWQAARLPGIAPQPHDVPMHAIVTECGLQVRRPPFPTAPGWA